MKLSLPHLFVVNSCLLFALIILRNILFGTHFRMRNIYVLLYILHSKYMFDSDIISMRLIINHSLITETFVSHFIGQHFIVHMAIALIGAGRDTKQN